MVAPIHRVSTQHPLLGDTTSSQSLVYSPPIGFDLMLDLLPIPAYPNYTLPSPLPNKIQDPELNGTSLSSRYPMFPLIVETSKWADMGGILDANTSWGGLASSMCAIHRAINSTGDLSGFGPLLNSSSYNVTKQLAGQGGLGANTASTFVQRSEGWRWDWITSNLEPDQVNYTVWAVLPRDDFFLGSPAQSITPTRGTLFGPMYMTTKETTFPCPLVHNLDICPSIGYAAPLDPIDGGEMPFAPITTLPEHLENALTTSLNSFSTSLLSQACDRDLYSPVSSCTDCFGEYRDWLCRSIVPRCASQQQTQASTEKAESSSSSSDSDKSSKIPMTVRRNASSPRTSLSANPAYDYDELLPCLANCRRVDRRCPVFLGFRCPVRGVTAHQSYAYCGPDEEDDGKCEGESDRGANVWGDVWCNSNVRQWRDD